MAASSHNLTSTAAVIQAPRKLSFSPPGLLDLYVAREMLMPFIVTIIAALVIFLGNELYWTLVNVMWLPTDPDAVLRWLFLSIPKIAVLAVPVATVFAVSMATHRLARENEITSWRMCGASVFRIICPFFLMALLISAGVFWLNERIVPWTSHQREVIMQHEIRRADPINWIENDSVFKAGDGNIFYVHQVDRRTNLLTGIVVYRPHPKPEVYLEVVLADSGKRIGKKWILNNCIVHQYDAKTGIRLEKKGAQIEGKIKEIIIQPRETPVATFSPQKTQPWEMTSTELGWLIRDQESKGLRTPSLQVWRVEYHRKFSIPLAALAVAFVAAPLALFFARSGSFAGFLIAVTLVFFYQGFDGWFGIMGWKAFMPPFVAAWATNMMYGIVGLVLLVRHR